MLLTSLLTEKNHLKMNHQATGHQAAFMSFSNYTATSFLYSFFFFLFCCISFYFSLDFQYQLVDNLAALFSYVYVPLNPAYNYPLMRH